MSYAGTVKAESTARIRPSLEMAARFCNSAEIVGYAVIVMAIAFYISNLRVSMTANPGFVLSIT